MLNKSKAGAFFIFVTVVIDCIGLGLIIPSLPDVIRRFITDPVQIASYFGYFISVFALMQFLASPVLGSLSDKYGRRPILLISLLGAGLDYIMMAYAPNLEILFIGRILAGTTAANFTVAMSYMADVSDDSNRSSNFGLIGAGFGLGFIIGPAIGGLLGVHNPQTPFLVAAALNLLNFAYGLFVLPESLPLSMRRNIEIKKLNPLKTLSRIFKPSAVLGLIFGYFIFQMAGQVHPSAWTLFTQHKFGWTAEQVGYSLAMVGVMSAISQGGLTRVIIPRIGEYQSLLWGAVILMISFFAFAYASEGWMMYVILIVSGVAWVAQPALQSLITKKTPPQEQGELQGSLVSLMSLASILCPIISTKIFAAYTDTTQGIYFPGAPYFYGAIMYALSLVVILKYRKSAAMSF